MSGHTPGPWVAREPTPDNAVPVRDAEGGAIALVWGSNAEAVSNAALIAAAPDLLAELKWCAMGAGNLTRIAAAIAKATTTP